MKKEFTPEDLADIQAAYQNHGAHVRWMLRGIVVGAAIGIGLAALCGGVSPGNPVLWVGLIYGTVFSSIRYTSPGLSIKEFVFAPVAYAKELKRRVGEIGAGRRALKERFADHY